jgi:GNAT superfamily N-acetyltransferase
LTLGNDNDWRRFELPPFQVSDFREHQRYGPTIADRVWNAWWKKAGLPLSNVESHMIEMAEERPLPMAIVAHDERGYLGSAFLIHSDMEERRQYSPWVAAVWVEASERKRGVGRALVIEGARMAASLGYRAAYICCRPELEMFYLSIGFELVEQGAGANRLSVLKLDLVNPSGQKRRG